MDSSQQKTLPPTPRRIEKAREDGQTVRSQHLSHLIVFGFGSALLIALLPDIHISLSRVLHNQLTFDSSTLARPDLMLEQLKQSVWIGLKSFIAPTLGIALLSVISAMALGGWLITSKPLAPDLSRLNPLNGLSQIFSKSKLSEVGALTFIVTVLGVAVGAYAYAKADVLAQMAMQNQAATLNLAAEWLIGGLIIIMIILALTAAFDVPMQIFLLRQKLMMSMQELKEEMKESEGNPEIKSKRRALQREMAQRNSIRNVPKADFVLVNPTHYSVALRYEEGRMSAPVLVAKGTDLLAQAIRDVAKAHRIPTLEAPRLARALYAHAEIDQEIPSGLYMAVAQVLAYVYQVKAGLRAGVESIADMVHPHVPPELDPHHGLITSGASA